MMPSILRRTGPDIERNGVPVTPRGIVSTCEVCGEPAPFGLLSAGGYRSFCRVHAEEYGGFVLGYSGPKDASNHPLGPNQSSTKG